MGMPKWNRRACSSCFGSCKNRKNRKQPCPECNGSGFGNFCADCDKEITGSGHYENSDVRCICQDIPFGAI
jgi:DnaJ-class molecular chaperone